MKLSIVTPSFNKGRFISETIESVVSQKGDFEVEYIIVDGKSADNTGEIVGRYQHLLEDGSLPLRCKGVSLHHISEQDSGMYDAINKGFSMATGDIFAWINADDVYLPGAFSFAALIFTRFPHVRWIKGITSYIDDNSEITGTGRCFLYNQQWLEEGVYGRELYFVQQDSTFWRSNLWGEIGGIPSKWKLAGDYWLWKAFAGKTPLYSVNFPISCFRRTDGQLSSNICAYRCEAREISPHRLTRHKILGAYLAYETRIPNPLRRYVHRFLFGKQTYYLITLEGQTGLALNSGEYHEMSRILALSSGYSSHCSLEVS